MTPHAVVVGAGPVGALCALLLAARGVAVTLVEQGGTWTTKSHASTFHPATLDLLSATGIDLVADPDAVRVSAVQWRDSRGKVTAEIDYRLLEGLTAHPFRIHLDQQALLDRCAALIAAQPLITLEFGATVVGLDARRPAVTVTVTDGSRRDLAADIVIGCDGANSAVRAISGIGFPAADYPTGAVRAFVSTDLAVLTDAADSGPALSGLCYFRGADDGVSVLRMSTHTRLIVRTAAESDDVARLREALGHATPFALEDLDVDRIDSYRLRRGVADTYLSDTGPVLILGDAAHVTSTAGGLNMNAGIHDAFAVMPVVADWLHGRAERHSVARIAGVRRRHLLDDVIPRSERRVRGLQDADPGALRRHLDDIAILAADPAAARQFLIEASLLDAPLIATGSP
ncbi:MAG: FAD-dependent oxidoreductase [Mycobacterium sp.]